MYFSLFAILYSTLIFQTAFVASAPILSRDTESPEETLSELNDTIVPSPQARATEASPRFVIYTDATINSTSNGLPDPKKLQGYTQLLLGFHLASGPADQAEVWAKLPAAQRKSLKQQYAAAGLKVMVSAFGGTDTPTTKGQDPVKIAQTLAAFVKNNDLDGIDVDYEDLDAVKKGTAPAWIISLTSTLRRELPAGQFLITHAPLAPHLSPAFEGGPYLQVHKKVGTMIDWYNVQFYNDGNSEYTDCAGLLTKSSQAFPKSSLFEIEANGVPLSKLVIGKPLGSGDANNGIMTPALLATCVGQAKKKGWTTGLMVFEDHGNAKQTNGFIAPSRAALGGANKGRV